jgi:hypothetical protein
MTTALSPSSRTTVMASTLQYLPEYMLPEPATIGSRCLAILA